VLDVTNGPTPVVFSLPFHEAGAPTADFVEPWSDGLAQDAASERVRSAVIAAKHHHFPAETVVYCCSAGLGRRDSQERGEKLRK
jgi:hypothetical protein